LNTRFYCSVVISDRRSCRVVCIDGILLDCGKLDKFEGVIGLSLERGFQAVPECCDHSALRRDARLARACGALARQAQNHLVWDRGLYGFTGERQWLESHRARQRNGVGSVRKSDAQGDLATRF